MAQAQRARDRSPRPSRSYVAQRDRCVTGETAWSTIGRWFTEDAVFIDPAWGRFGRP